MSNNSINNSGNGNFIFQDIKDSQIDTHDINFYQQKWENIKSKIDLDKLQEELKILKETLVKEAKTPEHFSSISEIVKAEEQVKKKNGPKILEFLKKSGRWTFDVATKIGAALAAAVIKEAIGL